LLAKEALDVLALRPGATSAEIKEAYRDLVKVWHPDRFGNDARLRRKAEGRLKLINTAYRVLQSDRGMGSVESDGFASSVGGDASSRSASWSEPVPGTTRARSHRSSMRVGWLYVCVAIALGLMAGYAALEHWAIHNATQVGRASAPASVRQVEASNQQMTAAIPSMQTPGETLAGHGIPSPKLPERNISPALARGFNSSSSARFRVRSLSDAETDQLEKACARQKELKDAKAYQTCMKAQLDVITNASPDLSTLSPADRESIESVCSGAKQIHGIAGHNRCLNAQMVELAAEPGRPDLSTLNEVDRDSIEAACRNAKYREGPAAYNRCRMGLVKLLAESK
jgi:hypothetical protein